MLQVRLNSYTFHYTEKGKGDPLVLVHGSSSDLRTWENQVDDFSRTFHTYTYSRRYHWPNEPIGPGQDYTMEEHVEDLEAFFKYIKAYPVHLVGHSYGGFISLLFAMKNPHLVRSLTIAEAPVITLFVSSKPKPSELFGLLFSKPKMTVALAKFGVNGIMPAIKALEKGEKHKAQDAIGEAILGKESYGKLSKARHEMAMDNLIAEELTGSGFPPVSKKEIRKMNLPVLLLQAQDSPYFFHGILDELEHLIKNADRRMIKNSSHIMQEDNPRVFNQFVISFLENY